MEQKTREKVCEYIDIDVQLYRFVCVPVVRFFDVDMCILSHQKINPCIRGMNVCVHVYVDVEVNSNMFSASYMCVCEDFEWCSLRDILQEICDCILNHIILHGTASLLHSF